MKNPRRLLQDLSIRARLLLGYSATFLLAVAVGSSILYSVVRSTIEENIENELANSTNTIRGMVKTAVDVSIINHLRAVAEKNLEIVASFYMQYRNGELEESVAMEKTARVLRSQIIGSTGYIYCIDSKGVIKVHPKGELIGVDLSEYAFIQEQKRKKGGYIQYEWANPGDKVKRPKALYMTYFAYWDWIISVSSYREEFEELLTVDDFRDNILSISFGKTGYSFVMDSRGNLIVHPKLQGKNIYDSRDDDGRMFIKEVCEKKNGKIVYPWKNPGESRARQKLVVFNYLPELDWIVASSSYLNEFYRPLTTIAYTAGITIALMLLLMIPITWRLSSTIVVPLKELMGGFAKGARGDFSGSLKLRGGGELHRLAHYYNDFMEKLRDSSRQLLESEAKYRSIFENSVEGVFQATPAGTFITVNPSMAAMLAYSTLDDLIAGVTRMDEELFVDKEHYDEVMQTLARQDTVAGYETRFYCGDKSAIWVSINARAIKGRHGKMRFIQGFVTDITERKKSEEFLRRSNEELEQRVEQRTFELTNRVKELKQRSSENTLLREMIEMIQVCRSSSEIYPMTEPYFRKFFPDDQGDLFMYNEQRTLLVSMACWGKEGKHGQEMTHESCWALRQGKPYLVKGAEDRVFCPHHLDSPSWGSLCVPIIALGETLGMLDIRLSDPLVAAKEKVNHLLERKQVLAVTITEHLALAMANLNLRETLRLQSIHDPLTGLYNRRYLEEFMAREEGRSRRHGYSLGIIMIDADHFKSFNDTYGHDAGDSILSELGSCLKGNMRAEDMACRYGGEEFVLILTQTSLSDTVKKAEALCREIGEKLVVEHRGQTLTMTASLGVAGFPEHGRRLKEVLKAADSALYQAKVDGRARVAVARQSDYGRSSGAPAHGRKTRDKKDHKLDDRVKSHGG